MRSSLVWLVATLAATSFAAPQEGGSAISVEEAIGKSAEKEATTSEKRADTSSTTTESEENQSTTFNGVKVPSLPEIDGSTWDETISDGWW